MNERLWRTRIRFSSGSARRESGEDPDPLPLKTGPPAEGGDQPPIVVTLERDGHGIDREVAAKQILPNRGVLDGGQGRRRVVELRPCGDDGATLAFAVD